MMMTHGRWWVYSSGPCGPGGHHDTLVSVIAAMAVRGAALWVCVVLVDVDGVALVRKSVNGVFLWLAIAYIEAAHTALCKQEPKMGYN